MKENKETKVLLFDTKDLDGAEYELFRGKASDVRRKKADRYIREEDGKICVMAEALVRYAYLGAKGKDSMPEIVYRSGAKPYAENEEDFYFSISHAGSVIAVAYGDSETGVDIELTKRKLDRKAIADAVFTTEEKKYVFENADGMEERFIRLWTVKESYMKYLGKGFGKNPLTFTVDCEKGEITEIRNGRPEKLHLREFRLSDEYYMTVCGEADTVNIKYISAEELVKSIA